MKKKSVKIGLAAVVIIVLAAVIWFLVINRSLVPGEKGHYTYRYTDDAPDNFSPLSWSSDSERDVLSYTTSSLYIVSDGDSLEYSPMLASAMPEDVTAAYAGNETYGVSADASEGYAFRITIRDDASWSDGTAITTADFEYSLKLYLDDSCSHKSDYYNSYASLANAAEYLADSYVCAYDSDNGYADVDDSELYFGMTSVNGLFKTCSLEEYYSYYYQDKPALFINDDNVNIYERLAELAGDEDYVPLTNEIKELLQDLCANFGATSDERYKRLCFYNDDENSVSWEDVGFIVEDDYTMTFVLSKQVSQEEFISALSDLLLVQKAVYESDPEAYGTSAEQYVSYGPYVIASCDDEGMTLEANESWFGYSDDTFADLYQTTDIEIAYGLSDEDALAKFTEGNLDQLDLGENESGTYAGASSIAYSENNATCMLSINMDMISLSEDDMDGESHAILAYKDFRHAISLAIDRDAYVQEVNPEGAAEYGLFNSSYIEDISELLSYRDVDKAVSVLTSIYGESDENGTVVYYDIDKASEYIQSAYDACLMDGNISVTDQVTIDCYFIHDELASFLQDALDAASAGTSLEGRITVRVTEDKSEADICEEAVSVSDSLNIYEALQDYLDLSYAADDGFAAGIQKLSITIDGEKISKTYAQWYGELMYGEYSSASRETQAAIVAGLEKGLLTTYKNIPLYDSCESYLLSQRIEAGSCEYAQTQGDVLRYMTYSMDDKEWSNYCKKSKYELDYSGTEDASEIVTATSASYASGYSPAVAVAVDSDDTAVGEIDVYDYEALDEIIESSSTLNSSSAAERREWLEETMIEALLSFEETVDVSGYGITQEDMAVAAVNVINGDYRFCYVSSEFSYSYSRATGIVAKIYFTYTATGDEAISMLAELEAAIEEVADGADSSWSDMEKALYINDYLARTCEYDTSLTDHTAYGALVEHCTVCEGYAKAFYAVGERLGLNCGVVVSTNLSHEWSYVQIGDSYYYIDVTWDDPTTDMLGQANHDYFLKSYSYFHSTSGGHTTSDWIYSGDDSDLDSSYFADTSYDDYFWDDITRGFDYIDGYWYTINDRDLEAYVCDGSSFEYESTLYTISDLWYKWKSTTSYPDGYSYIASYDGVLYYSTPSDVWAYDLDTGSSESVYTLSSTYASNGYIYGMRIMIDGSLDIRVATSYSATGTVYTVMELETQSSTEISACTIKVDDSSLTYDGTQQLPDVTITYGSYTLVEGEDYAIASLDNTGAGEKTLYVVGMGDYTGIYSTTFTISKAAQTVTASAASTSIAYGKTTTITASASDGGTISYSTSNSSVAAVSGSGSSATVTGKGAGTAVITVTAAATDNYNQATATITITVTRLSQTLSASYSSVTIAVGNTSTLSISGAYTSLSYSSSDSSVASVSSSGVITAKKVGTVTITVTAAQTSAYAGASKTITVKVKPAAATISSVKNTSSGVKITWSQVTGATGYYIYRSTSKSGTYTKVGTVTKGTTVTFTNKNSGTYKVASGTTYYYKVYAYASTGTASASSAKSIRYLTAGKVTSLKNTKSGIKVTWSKVSGASGYYVYRKVSGGSYKKIATVSGASTVTYTNASSGTYKVVNGKTYAYYVIPYYKNSSGTVTKGSYSVVKKRIYVAATSISSLKNSSSKKMTVKWSKNSKATGYQIQYSTSSSFTSSKTKTVTITSNTTISKKIGSLTKGKTYYVRVRCYKTSSSGTKHYSAWSTKKKVKISK
ncbi:MAG: ABC transporter substrate-binding protein [Clostridiales bacterium]|nr:ABC transporter substrate-binding protein [Clostridiales bacterium]